MKVIDRDAGTVEVSGTRKAFKLVLDKDALLPGIYALGGLSFVAEQEIHGLERVYPWHIKDTYTAESLNEELPIRDAVDQHGAGEQQHCEEDSPRDRGGIAAPASGRDLTWRRDQMQLLGAGGGTTRATSGDGASKGDIRVMSGVQAGALLCREIAHLD